MGRRRIPKVKALGRSVRRKELSVFLIFIGRVGKLLKERNVDPATAWFVPGSFHVVSRLNPNIPLNQDEWDQIFEEASKWVAERYRYVFDYHTKCVCGKECMRYCDFLATDAEDLSEYFHELQYFTKDDFLAHGSILTTNNNVPYSNGKPVLFQDLSNLCNTRFKDFQIDDNRVLFWANDWSKKEEDFVKVKKFICWYTFKLSDYGKKAVLHYFKEQETRNSSFKIRLQPKTLKATAGQHSSGSGILYSFQHTNTRKTKNVLQKTLQKICTDVVDSVFEDFTDYFMGQHIELNGIELTEPVKKLLASKMKPHVYMDGLKSISKVFQALRDNINSIDDVAAVLLTADEEDEREAGRALIELQNQMESEDEEED